MARWIYWGMVTGAALGVGVACDDPGPQPLVRAVPVRVADQRPTHGPDEARPVAQLYERPVLSRSKPAAVLVNTRAPAPGVAKSQPQSRDVRGASLAQTREYPAPDSPAFGARMNALWQAIVEDKPELARQAFFPKVAYLTVKASSNPGRDWERRLWRQFEDAIHRYHRRLGKHRGDCELVGIEVKKDRARWMKPGKEHNRVGYWRSLRSRMRYRDDAGKARSLELTSLISWRGEWYVVHLDGFK